MIFLASKCDDKRVLIVKKEFAEFSDFFCHAHAHDFLGDSEFSDGVRGGEGLR